MGARHRALSRAGRGSPTYDASHLAFCLGWAWLVFLSRSGQVQSTPRELTTEWILLPDSRRRVVNADLPIFLVRGPAVTPVGSAGLLDVSAISVPVVSIDGERYGRRAPGPVALAFRRFPDDDGGAARIAATTPTPWTAVPTTGQHDHYSGQP
jgi:hypothetical protein